MVDFVKFAKISNNYCVCYFGYSDEYLIQLRLLKPVLETEFPGLNIYIGCQDDKAHLLGDSSYVLRITELKAKKEDFAYIKELRFDGSAHPVLNFLDESKIVHFGVPVGISIKTTKCVIVTKSQYPTKPLEIAQIETLKKMARDNGFEPVLDETIKNAGLVMGVESPDLFEAAGRGIETVLVPTGLGTRLYKGMFSNGIVMST